jgi:hypothetical protein
MSAAWTTTTSLACIRCAHWRELPDELSAYMGFTLRNLGSGAAAVSTEGCPTGAKFRLLIPFT